MKLTQAQINRYNRILNRFQDESEKYFRSLMEVWHERNPGASVVDSRNFCIAAMEEALGIYGPAAVELADQLFDFVCDGEGIDARGVAPPEPVPHALIVDAVRYAARKVAGGDWDGFVDSGARLSNFYIRRSAYEAMKASCKDGHVRWARVPTGRETCGYCFMLASRGFEYVSEDTAKAGSHVGCDCIVVPGKHGRTEVEGYDPAALHERWRECQEASGSGDYTDVIKEVETRDWGWLWTGREPGPSKDG